MLRRAMADQRCAYVAAGGFNTALGFAVFAATYQVAGGDIGYLGALAFAYACVFLAGFAVHRRFVFRVEGRVLPDLLRYAAVQGGALTMNALILPVVVERAGAPVVPAQLISLALTVVLTYLLHRGYTFRRDPPQPATVLLRGGHEDR